MPIKEWLKGMKNVMCLFEMIDYEKVLYDSSCDYNDGRSFQSSGYKKN